MTRAAVIAQQESTCRSCHETVLKSSVGSENTLFSGDDFADNRILKWPHWGLQRPNR
jgi:hypothetical protein